MVDDRNIRNYANSTYMNFEGTIVRPDINFKIKGILIQHIMSVDQYKGVAGENPYSHLRTFLDICARFARYGVSHEALRLLLFPFSLAPYKFNIHMGPVGGKISGEVFLLPPMLNIGRISWSSIKGRGRHSAAPVLVLNDFLEGAPTTCCLIASKRRSSKKD